MTSEFCFIIYTYPCFEIKILLRILLFQQYFVRILIFYKNFVSYSHHYLHLPVSRNQNSAYNFAFPAEFCQNSYITAEFCFIIYTYPCLEIKILLRILAFPAEICQKSDITAEFCFIISAYPCLEIKILLRILLFQQKFVRILISQQNFVSLSTATLVSESKFCLEFCFSSSILSEF